MFISFQSPSLNRVERPARDQGLVGVALYHPLLLGVRPRLGGKMPRPLDSSVLCYPMKFPLRPAIPDGIPRIDLIADDVPDRGRAPGALEDWSPRFCPRTRDLLLVEFVADRPIPEPVQVLIENSADDGDAVRR